MLIQRGIFQAKLFLGCGGSGHTGEWRSQRYSLANHCSAASVPFSFGGALGWLERIASSSTSVAGPPAAISQSRQPASCIHRLPHSPAAQVSAPMQLHRHRRKPTPVTMLSLKPSAPVFRSAPAPEPRGLPAAPNAEVKCVLSTPSEGFRSSPGAIQSDAITLRLFVIWVAGSDLRRASCFCRTWPNRSSSRRFYD